MARTLQVLFRSMEQDLSSCTPARPASYEWWGVSRAAPPGARRQSRDAVVIEKAQQLPGCRLSHTGPGQGLEFGKVFTRFCQAVHLDAGESSKQGGNIVSSHVASYFWVAKHVFWVPELISRDAIGCPGGCEQV